MTWGKALIRDVATFVMGQAPPGAEVNEIGLGIPFFRSGEFEDIRPKIAAWTTKPLRLALPTDVFVCVVGANAGEVNRGADGAIGRSIGAVRSGDRLDHDYLYYFLRSIEVYLRNAAQGSAQAVISKDDLGRIEIPLPVLKEQRAIAGVLGALDDKIESNRRIQNLLELESQVLYERYYDHDPESSSCMEVKLAELADINPPRQLKRGSIAKYVEMSSLPTKSALIEYWEEREVGSGQKFQNGDTLVARITPCLENGKGAFVNFLNENEVAWGSTEYIVLRPREPLPLPWAYCLSRTARFRDFAIRHMNGSSGRQRCDASALKEYLVRVASADSTNEFTECATKNFERMGFARNENQALEKLRNVLLPELLAGRLRVKDAESMMENV
jgi:type I restriction enzyme S subunit